MTMRAALPPRVAAASLRSLLPAPASQRATLSAAQSMVARYGQGQNFKHVSSISSSSFTFATTGACTHISNVHFFSTAGISSDEANPIVEPDIPTGSNHFSDFFGEPVTFLDINQQSSSSPAAPSDPSLAMAALDKHIVSVVSRGKSAEGGGDEEGIPTKSSHSYALSWVELLERAQEWNMDGAAHAPMLVAAAVSPLLVQAGSAYAKNLDDKLANCAPSTITGLPIQLIHMAEAVTSLRESSDSENDLSPRELLHLNALHHLVQDEHRLALGCYQRILQLCPGDALALSLALDASSTLSDGEAALHAAASVASYWNERGRRGLPGVTNAVQPGHSIGTALIAVGYAAGGRYVEAERLAEEALTRDDAGAGGVAVWALAATYDAEGRASEGTSMLSGYDGMQHYEKCGHLFFDSRLSGYGARFTLDRDAAGAGRSAGRMYSSAFERIIQYSAQPDIIALARKAPQSTRSRMVERAGGAAKSVFSKLFGGGGNAGKNAEADESSREREAKNTADPAKGSKQTAVDVLCWLPPTPQVLTDATMLLLRLTFAGTISESDSRWRDLKAAWERQLILHSEADASSVLTFCPLARVAASLVLENKDLCNGDVDPVFNKLAEAAHLMGRAMNLGGEPKQAGGGDENATSKQMWRNVANCLAEARHGKSNSLAEASFQPLQGWDMDKRPLLDQGLCHAAVMSDDLGSLCLARAVCSEAVSLRPNSPESWWRYSVVLDRLGDENAAEDARAASISLGAGEGGRL